MLPTTMGQEAKLLPYPEGCVPMIAPAFAEASAGRPGGEGRVRGVTKISPLRSR